MIRNQHIDAEDIPKSRVRIPDYVYLISCQEFVKIGKTSDVKSRMIDLQMCNPHKLRLIASFESYTALEHEARLHESLSEFHVRGEWFSHTRDFRRKLCVELVKIFGEKVEPAKLFRGD